MLLKKKTLNYELPSQIKAVTQVSFIENTEYHLFITQKFAAKILPWNQFCSASMEVVTTLKDFSHIPFRFHFEMYSETNSTF